MKLKRGTKRIAILLYYSIAIVAIFLFGTKSTFAADSPATNHLLINEVYPNPIDVSDQEVLTKEWIELYNPTANDIILDNFSIEDNTAIKGLVKLDGLIVPKNGYLLLISGTDFKFGLNNDGDILILKNGDKIIDQVIYGDTKLHPENAEIPSVSESITRKLNALDTDNNSVDFVVADPTPGMGYERPVDANPGYEPINIKDARNSENGEEVTVIGVVTVLPGTLSTQYFYIQDSTGGIQIYCYHKTFPTLAIGDSISVIGELSETNNERRIKISGTDKIVIQNHTEPIPPAEIAISDIGEEEEGTLVKTMGIVTETSGDTFYISDGQNKIKVVINKSTGINKPKMKKGDQVEVTGIVSQYKDEYRILPIDQDDVKIISTVEELPRAGNGEFFYIILSIFSTILWNIYQRAKKKLLMLRRRLLLLQGWAIYLRSMEI